MLIAHPHRIMASTARQHPTMMAVHQQHSPSQQQQHQAYASSQHHHQEHPHQSSARSSSHSPLTDTFPHNSLGLIVPCDPSEAATSASASPLSQHDAPVASHLIAHRHRSVGSISSISSAGSIYETEPTVLHRPSLLRSFSADSSIYASSNPDTNDLHEYGAALASPCESPFAMTRSISGLFIGTPDQHARLALQSAGGHAGSPLQPTFYDENGNGPATSIAAHHGALLALSHGNDELVSTSASGPQHQPTAHPGAYTLAAPPVHGLLGQKLFDGDESTPMPMSTRVFEGQPPMHLHGQQEGATNSSGLPATPYTTRSGVVMGGTPASFASSARSPDSHVNSSPFEGFPLVQTRMHRSDSIDSYTTSNTSPMSEVGYMSLAEKDAFREALAFGQAFSHGALPMHSPSASSVYHLQESPLPPSAGMSRIASAPAFMQPAGQHGVHTPARPIPMNQHRGRGEFAIPTTPASASRGSISGEGGMSMVSHAAAFGMPPSTPEGRMIHVGIPHSAPGGPLSFLDSPVSMSSVLGSAGKQKRPRARQTGPPPLVVSSNDKTHVCWCGKRFKRMEHLKRHNKVHTQEKPYLCTYPGCQKAFGRTDNLAQHIKTHYRPNGFSAPPPEFLAATAVKKEARHDPHAAATAAAAAAAAISANMTSERAERSADGPTKRRCTISEGVPAMPQFEGGLGQPFGAAQQQHFDFSGDQHRVPLHSIIANSSPEGLLSQMTSLGSWS